MSINAMHAKSGLRVVLKWKIYRPDSVIVDVITLRAGQVFCPLFDRVWLIAFGKELT